MKKITIKILAIVAAIAAVVIGVLIFTNNNFNKYLDLGNKALLDMDYDNAIIAFDKAIDIDPKRPEAYIGMAEVYVALEEYGTAYEYLEKGYHKTNHISILEKMDEVIAAQKENDASGETGDTTGAADNDDTGNDSNSSDLENENGDNSDNNGDGSATDDDGSDDEDSNDEDALSEGKTSLGFDPRAFTFFGYPVCEDHYEEWKAAIGYNGNEDPMSEGNRVPSGTYGDIAAYTYNGAAANEYHYSKMFDLSDPANYYMDAEYGEIMTPYLFWGMDGMDGKKYSAGIQSLDTTNYKHIIEEALDGPIHIGDDLQTVLNMINSGTELVYSAEPVTLDDGVNIVFQETTAELGPFDKHILASRDDFYLQIAFKGDKVVHLVMGYN